MEEQHSSAGRRTLRRITLTRDMNYHRDKSILKKLASVRKSAQKLADKLDILDIEEFQGQSMTALKLLLEALILAIQSYSERER